MVVSCNSDQMRIHIFSCLLLISLLRVSHVLHVSGQCLDDQRLLLLQLKNGLEFDERFSTKLVNWNQSLDCCKWNGVDCDTSGYVIGLDLENETISGGIEKSTGLFGLQHLGKLNLAYNNFDGCQIPKGLQNLTNLAYLNLSNAGFGGQVPIEVAMMKSLISLDLSSLFWVMEPLKLENPNLQMFVQNLAGLRELHLDYVDISAQRSDWCQALSSSLPNLTTLSLRYCGLSGPLDSSLSKLHSLEVLRLEGNIMSTTVPNFFGEFSNLTTLILSNCFLQGPFPEKVFQVSTLRTLDLSINRLLTGTIPTFPLSSSFRTIVLSYTNFSGSLPDSISNLRMLSKIDLSNCNFTGIIPFSIANLTELEYVDFSYNHFTGSIPPFPMSKKLTYLDLSRNSLTGSLSSVHFDGLTSLANINLANNFLSGSIPQSFFLLPSLEKLHLSNNKFSGQIDDFSPSNSSNLDTLDLSSNRLQGSIPESFFKLEQLNVLSLSSNFFNGTVKLEMIERLHNLARLEIGYNNLSVDTSSSNSSSSQFPQLTRLNLASCNLYNFPNLANQSKLIFLDLSINYIKGEIPSWIWNIGGGSLAHLNLSHNLLVDLQKPVSMSPFLGALDLHSNSLSGEFPMLPKSAVYVDYSRNSFKQPIPVNIVDSTFYLTFLSLSNNSLIGTIPTSFCDAMYLQVLDLSVNNLSGAIPPCLVGNSSSLGVLNLRRNNLSGNIPDTISVNCSLKTLDLSNNNLEGKFPASLANCKSLEVMNAGNNKINDAFPCSLKISSSLRVLVLRNNKFHGDLTCSWVNGSWLNLQIIDIASNNFNGELHPRFTLIGGGMVQHSDTQVGGNHISYNFLNLSNLYYQDAVTVTIKGLEMELVKILTVFTAIDLSCNNFSGVIPETVGVLSALYILNLSHNAFTGTIPKSIGNLSELGSLDLSMNQLTGEIPKDLTSLTFLSVLNLSYNKLVGRIPIGPQFQTFPKDSFAQNSGLCGFPLNISCDSDGPEEKPAPSLNKIDFDLKFVFAGWGYVVGVTLFFASLVFCDNWREHFNDKMDKFLDLILPGH